MVSNTSILKTLSPLKGEVLEITLDENFSTSLQSFRSATSRIRRIKNEVYPAVYLIASDF